MKPFDTEYLHPRGVFIIERCLSTNLLFSELSYRNVYGFVIHTKFLLPIAAVVPIAVNATAEIIDTIKTSLHYLSYGKLIQKTLIYLFFLKERFSPFSKM